MRALVIACVLGFPSVGLAATAEPVGWTLDGKFVVHVSSPDGGELTSGDGTSTAADASLACTPQPADAITWQTGCSVCLSDPGDTVDLEACGLPGPPPVPPKNEKKAPKTIK